VPLVGQVAGVNLKPPRAGLITDHRVEQRVVGRAEGVGAVPGLANVAHATADRDALQTERGETVFRPQRGLVFGNGFDPLAGIVAAFHHGVAPGCLRGGHQVETWDYY
jgi:hypothetical protein